ncbi:MAG: hypothetical protein AB7U24_08125 [Sulfurimonadaceae bacterium]|jgi:hypothetical protein
MMLDTQEYENFKESLIGAQRLFEKLRSIVLQAEALQYDDSGFFNEGEERLSRQRSKLNQKLLEHIKNYCPQWELELVQSKNLETTRTLLHLKEGAVTTKIEIDYAKNDSISITQLS